VEVQPLSDGQITAFLQKELPQQWSALWQRLAEAESGQRRLLDLARNPYILTMMIDVYWKQGQLGRNQAELMERFTGILLSRDKDKYRPDEWLDVDIQREALSILAFEMQERPNSGTMVKRYEVEHLLPERIQPGQNLIPAPPLKEVLTLAANAHIIEMPVDHSSLRFYHQLLQEYFAARQMLKRVALTPQPPLPRRDTLPLVGEGESKTSPPLGGIEGGRSNDSLTPLWRWPWLESEMPRPAGNYNSLPPPPPTGWEETTILAAGLAAENDDQLVQALIRVNPVLAGRCLHEGQATVAEATRQGVIEALLTTIARPEVALRVRIAAGEVLGYLGDLRLGELVTIPAGEFWMGGEGKYDGKPQHKLYLPEYQIGKYPLTNAEFATFIEAGGYRERRWWTEAGWAEKEKPQYEDEPWTKPRYWADSRFNKPNQPVVGISWYEGVAYCRWVSAETGKLFRLPTEAEWEKAARGPSTSLGAATAGRVYPWGDEFEASRLNARVGEQQVRATTPVGIYPSGVSPFGLFDCAGNVWEWCATALDADYNYKPYPYDIEEDEWSEEYLNRTDVRVLRGGSWDDNNTDDFRAAFRDGGYPNNWDDYGGFWLVALALS